MEVIPAIDLRGAKCVRLYQGDYDRETVYSDDPIDVALQWVALGATRLHIVDLDGARDGAPRNLAVVGRVASSVSVPLQVGGGIRTVETAKDVISLGVERVVISTAVVERPEMAESFCSVLGPQAVAVSVDARDGYVATDGWTRSTEVTAPELIGQLADMGVRRFIYTDIVRDGTLTEPNFEAIESLLSQTQARLIAAGGISSVQHLRRLDELGVDAAVVGKALYTGSIRLDEALEAVRSSVPQ